MITTSTRYCTSKYLHEYSLHEYSLHSVPPIPFPSLSHLRLAHPQVGGAVDGLLSVPREHPLEVRLLAARAADHLEGLHPSEPLRVGELGGRGEGPVVTVVPAGGVRLRRKTNAIPSNPIKSIQYSI